MSALNAVSAIHTNSNCMNAELKLFRNEYQPRIALSTLEEGLSAATLEEAASIWNNTLHSAENIEGRSITDSLEATGDSGTIGDPGTALEVDLGAGTSLRSEGIFLSPSSDLTLNESLALAAQAGSAIPSEISDFLNPEISPVPPHLLPRARRGVSFNLEVIPISDEKDTDSETASDTKIERFEPEDNTASTWEFFTHLTISRDQTAASDFESLQLIALYSKSGLNDLEPLQVRNAAA
jgi:hypothetical protein